MAVLEGPLYGDTAAGKVKSTLSFHTRSEWFRVIDLPRSPTRPTPGRQAQWDLFAAAVSEWNSLTPEEKEVYNAQAHDMLTGYNIFIAEALT